MRKQIKGLVEVFSTVPEKIKHSISTVIAPLTPRERLVYGVLFVGFVSLVAAPRIVADVGDEGSLFSVAATQCSSSDSWLAPENIAGQPSLPADGTRADITAENSALWSGEAGVTECGGYSPSLEHSLIDNALSLVVKAVNAPGSEFVGEIPSSDLSSTTLQDGAVLSKRIDSRGRLIEPNMVGEQAMSTNLDALLVVSVSQDNGKTWRPLHTFGEELLTETRTTYNVALPQQYLAADASQVAFRVEVVRDDPTISVLLDALLWTYEVGSATELTTRLINADTGETLTADRPVLNQNDEIVVEIDIKDPNDGIWQGLRSRAGNLVDSPEATNIDVKTTLLNHQGAPLRSVETQAEYTGTDLSNADGWQTSVAVMPKSSDPGLYTLRFEVSTPDAGVQTVTQDFLWGVLAINTDSDSYTSGETVDIQMSVLNELGETDCNAELSLRIDSPSGGATYTNNNGIEVGPTCPLYGDHIEPDYQASFETQETGNHTITLTATTSRGTFTVSESFEVATAPFRIWRSGPTRVYPVLDYPMEVRVRSEAGFSGVVTDQIPASFEVSTADFSQPFESNTVRGGTRTLSWNVDLAPGEEAVLGYTFDAPDIAPEFYLLGPMLLTNGSGSVEYEEQRQWQIAGDAVDVFRSTTYEFQDAEFTGTTYDLTLNNSLQANYFAIIVGPDDSTGNRGADDDGVRITADPHANFGSSTASDAIELTRGGSSGDWIGTVTIVECLTQCSTQGFQLSEVLETSLPAGAANTQQTVSDTLAANYTDNTVPIGGIRGGGMTSTSTGNNEYSATLGVKVSKTNSNEIQFDRYGAESRVPGAGTITSYIVEWGSEWNVYNANVTGTSAGSGLDVTSEFNTAAITSVTRANSWVWGAGFTHDDGLGDGAMGQVITLGDGVNQNTSETSVAVGGEGALISPGRDFEVYVMEHSALAVDYQFRTRGDTGSGSGFQELNIAIDAEVASETYDNVATDIQYTEGTRLPWLTTTSGGVGQAFSRTGAWGTRIDASTNLNYYRAYAGQPVTGWVQIVDFGGSTFSNVDTRQDGFRWRDDSADLNTSSGWLAAEDTNPAAQNKLTNLRLRLRVENAGLTPEEAARTYELQFATKFGFDDCAQPTVWTGIEDSASDEFTMYLSDHIDPDGELTSSSFLSAGGFSYVNGQGREAQDATGSIGPMAASAYTEVEYTVRPTTETINGRTYCFRVYDTAAGSVLDGYDDFPELTIASTQVVVDDGLGEVGTFTSAADGGWTTIGFATTYTTPVVIGLANSHDGQNALEFEVDNVTGSSADMRVCESEGSSANGCDAHGSETVAYMVIDAAVAATTPGIAAGTVSLSGGENGATNITYPSAFATAPYVFANVNSVNSTEFPISVVIRDVTTTQFNANICSHLLGSVDVCDTTHGSETVGWVAIEPGNEPFWEQFDNNSLSIDTDNGTWQPINFTETFATPPALFVAAQTDTGAQDVEIEGANQVSINDADIRFCEIDSADTCDSHNADTVAWHAMTTGTIDSTIELDQDGFRFYENTDGIQPSTTLGDEDTAIANVDDGDVLRLRLALQNGDTAPLPSGSTDFTLQYAQASDCSAASSWIDVGAIGSGAIWRGFNNATPADEAAITASLLDSASNTLMTYEEENDSAPNNNEIALTARGEWDWVIENNGAADFTSYCFRMITATDEPIHYSLYPRLTTSSGESLLDPNSPTNLGQEKTGGSSITTGEWINETTVVFTADVSDGNTSDLLELCVEAQPIGTSFTDTENNCGTPVSYTGSNVAAEVEISGLTNLVSYHWQARVRDAAGAYSSWVSYGGNGETEADFSIDTKPPNVTIYDGATTGVDIDFNNGDLNELTANWEDVNGIEPDSLSSLAVWLDGMDVDGDGDTADNPANGANITTWADKSSNSNDASDTGFSSPTYDATNSTVEFADTTQKLTATSLAGNTTGNVPKTFIVVHRLAGVADDEGGGVRYGTEASSISQDWHINETRRVRYGSGNDVIGPTLTSSFSVTTLTTSTGNATNMELFANGVSQGNGTDTNSWNFGDNLYLNADWTLATEQVDTPGNISVAEVLLFDEQLSTANREDIEEYLMCKWDIIDCTNTYERSIGTSPGGTNLLDWTTTTGTSSTDSDLTLNTSQPYYYNIRATDVAGNQAIYSSDGQFVAPTLSFSINATSLDLGRLNSGNNFTSTGSTTLTTSTNAYNGYSVRGYASGLLSNGIDTIPMFDGGTYVSPDAWETGDTGYGYTSSDTAIGGNDIFNGTPCDGGGSPPCYAPWSLSGPGDVIADHTDTISGTPVVSEQFTITHRVTTDTGQNRGDYATTIIYSITARY